MYVNSQLVGLHACLGVPITSCLVRPFTLVSDLNSFLFSISFSELAFYQQDRLKWVACAYQAGRGVGGGVRQLLFIKSTWWNVYVITLRLGRTWITWWINWFIVRICFLFFTVFSRAFDVAFLLPFTFFYFLPSFEGKEMQLFYTRETDRQTDDWRTWRSDEWHQSALTDHA